MAGWIGSAMAAKKGVGQHQDLRTAVANAPIMKRQKSGSGKSGPKVGGPASAALPNLKGC